MSSERTILVVDDDVLILRLVRESLIALLGCQVDTTASPEYAFELILKKRYDLLILDFNMAPIDGATLYSLVRTLFRVALAPRRNVPPMLLMSGNAAHRRAQELLREPGVRGWIGKPFTIQRLADKVREALGALIP